LSYLPWYSFLLMCQHLQWTCSVATTGAHVLVRTEGALVLLMDGEMEDIFVAVSTDG
jgi:hypothetical protein